MKALFILDSKRRIPHSEQHGGDSEDMNERDANDDEHRGYNQ